MSVHARRFACASLIAGLFVFGAAPCGAASAAQISQQLGWCLNGFGAAARQRIEACTGVIESGYAEGARLSAALRGRGDANLEIGNNDRALSDYEAAIRLDPANAAAFFGRGSAHYRIGGDGANDRAIADFSEAIRLDPDYQDALGERGRLYLNRRDYDHMIADYTTLIRIDPGQGGWHALRGSAYRGKHDLDKALADYDEAVRLSPRNVQALHGRGLVHQDMGDLDGAIADFGAAIAADPANVGIGGFFRDRGAAYRAKGDVDHAIADEQEAKRRGW